MKNKLLILLKVLFTIFLILIILAYMVINYYPSFEPLVLCKTQFEEFSKTDRGFAVFIVIPIFLLVRGELKNMLSKVEVKNVEEDGIEAKT